MIMAEILIKDNTISKEEKALLNLMAAIIIDFVMQGKHWQIWSNYPKSSNMPHETRTLL